ncbi:hypothetical protein [Nocardia sp. CY41]|uniref:hypothetical protein n=1 Tax=Nocardia sp. CY41 TaxID=2608686 RepID=UPI00135731F7|nr:hypothetical protein [Nocardia sp. CY41]
MAWSDLADRPLVVDTVSGTADAASWQQANPDRAVISCPNFDEWIAADRGIGVVPELTRTRAPHPGVGHPRVPAAPPYTCTRRDARPVPPRSVQRVLGGAVRPSQSTRGMRPSMSVNP